MSAAVLSHLEISPTSITVVAGQPVTYVVTAVDDFGNSTDVTSTAPLSITDGGCAPTSGVCTSDTVGTQTVTATYEGLTAQATQVVNPAATSTDLGSSVNPSVTGQSVTYSASVSVQAPGSGTPTGYIEFSDESGPIAACGGSSGVSLAGTSGASCTVTYPAAASHPISAQYLGDDNYTASTSSTLTQVVGPAATSTDLGSSVNPSVTGQSVTYSASVSVQAPGSGTPTGYIEFSDESGPIAACGGSSGVSLAGTSGASCTVTYPAAASHPISAQYLGDDNYTASTSSTLTQVVGPAATSTDLGSSVNPSVTGQSVTYSASVSVQAPGSGTPTGYIEFSDESGPIAACGGSSGVSLAGTSGAICTVTYPAAASHPISAQYLGDDNYTASTSSTLTQVVGPAATSTDLGSSVNPSVTGQSVTYSASVSVQAPGSGTPTGYIEFSDESGPIAACGGSSGVSLAGTSGASCTVTYPAAASHPISAQYLGDDNYTASTSSTLTQVVNPAATSTDLGSSVNPSVTGQSVTYSASVSVQAPGSGTPTGYIEFSDESGPIAACGGSSGVSLAGTSGAICTVTYPAAASHPISAQYLGDDNYTASTSSTLTQVVGPAATSTDLGSSVNPSVTGQSVTYSASVSVQAPGSGTPTGYIEFSDESGPIAACGGSSGVSLAGTSGAICTVTYPAAASHPISAQYLGDDNYTASTSSTLTQVVGPTATSATALSTDSATYVTGQTITVSATVTAVAPATGTPTGTVAVSDGLSPAQTCVITLVAGTGSCTVAEPSPGTVTFAGSYGGDGTFSASSGSAGAVVVSPAATATVVSDDASAPETGATFTFLVAVSALAPGSGTPQGTVVWTVTDPAGHPVACTDTTLTSGTATCAVTHAHAGHYSASAAFTDTDGDYAGSASATDTVVVARSATTTGIASVSASVTGQPFTVSVSVAPVAPGVGTPTGSVTVSDGTHTCVATLSGGSGHCSLTDPAGTYTITATYAGDADFATSATTGEDTVAPAATTTAITSISASVTGQPFTVAVAVTPVAPGAGTPTGSVTVSDGTQTCVATLSGGSGHCSLTDPAGTYTITATYSGDPDFTTSATTRGDTVAPAPQSITFTSSPPANATVGGAPYLVSAVGGASGNPVTFSSATPGVCAVSGATVTFVGAGTCTVDASQAGDADYLPAPTVAQSFAVGRVVKCRTRLELSPELPLPVFVGTIVTYGAFVEPVTGPAPLSGTVTFFVGGVAVPSCESKALIHNGARCAIAFVAPGVDLVTATYSGDPVYPDASDSSLQVVLRGVTAVTLPAPAPVAPGGRVTFRATVREVLGSGPLTGTVSFSENGAAIAGCQGLALSAASASCTVTFASAGRDTIDAAFSGDPDFVGSSAVVTQEVGRGSPRLTTGGLPRCDRGGPRYSVALTESGGSAPFEWSVSSGSLPRGLSLDAATGVISGTASPAAQTETFTVELTDATGATASQALTLEVDGGS